MDVVPTTVPLEVASDPPLPPHPIRLELTDTLDRARLVVFFRLLLALPHLLWLLLWSFLALAAVTVAWVAALTTGRVPLALHRFIAAWVRQAMHVAAFLSVVGRPFPGFVGAAGSYPVELTIDPPRRQSPLVTLFRGVLVIPAVMLGCAYALLLCVLALLGWWAALVTGRMPGGLRDLGAAGLRYCGQVAAYLFLLTDRYPCAAPGVEAT